MKFVTISAIAATLASTVSAADTLEVIGSFMFQRHGDRLAKPTVFLTPEGSDQTYRAGQFMKARYFDEDSDAYIKGMNETYDPTQVFAQCPNSNVLQYSHKGFLQGMYPPLKSQKIDDSTVQGASMANGSDIYTPLDGYQYVVSNGIPEDSPTAIEIEGTSGCATFTKASNKYLTSDDFYKTGNDTKKFYESLYPLVKDGLDKSDLNYANAYGVFDYMLVNSVHDKDFKESLKGHEDEFDRVRYLSDKYSKEVNYNSKDDKSYIGGRTLAAAVMKQLNETKEGGQKLTLYTGSYATFYQLFGALDMYSYDDQTFTGLIDYSGVAAFELVKKNGDLNVRFMVRNGTSDSDDIKDYPMFNKKTSDNLMPYEEFREKLGKVAIKDLDTWCSTCDAYDVEMCKAYSPELKKAASAESKSVGNNLTNAQAGGIGAGVTLGVVAIVGALAWLAFGRKKNNAAAANQYTNDVEHNGSSLTKEVSPSARSAHSEATR